MITDSSAARSTIEGDFTQSTAHRIDPRFVGKLIQNLRTDVYTNKPLACVREYYNNAVDSHRAAGVPINTIHIHAPNAHDPRFILRDFGLGLDREGTTQCFSSFGLSMKTTDLYAIGGFGIGAKAGNSYAETFTIRAFKDGRETIAISTSAKTTDDIFGAGSVNVVYEGDTTEPNGVEITINVEPRHIDAFHTCIQQMLYNKTAEEMPVVENMDVQSRVFRVVDLTPIKYKNTTIPIQARFITSDSKTHSVFMSVASVPYRTVLLHNYEYEQMRADVDISIEVTSEYIRPTLSREDVQNTPELSDIKQQMSAIIKDFIRNEIVKHAGAINQDSPSLTTARKAIDKLYELGYRRKYYHEVYTADTGHKIHRMHLAVLDNPASIVSCSTVSKQRIIPAAREKIIIASSKEQFPVHRDILNWYPGSKCICVTRSTSNSRSSLMLVVPDEHAQHPETVAHHKQYSDAIQAINDSNRDEIYPLLTQAEYVKLLKRLAGYGPECYTFREWAKLNPQSLTARAPSLPRDMRIEYNCRCFNDEASFNQALDNEGVHAVLGMTAKQARESRLTRDERKHIAVVFNGDEFPERAFETVDELIEEIVTNSSYDIKGYLRYYVLNEGNNPLNYYQNKFANEYHTKLLERIAGKDIHAVVDELKTLTKDLNANPYFSTTNLTQDKNVNLEIYKLVQDRLEIYKEGIKQTIPVLREKIAESLK